jgi:hypothetical protein
MINVVKITAILLVVAIASSNAQLISKKEFRLRNSKRSYLQETEIQKQNRSYSQTSSGKNLFLAGALSFIVPGAALGQFYKEEFINGGIRLGISIICIIWFFESPTFDFGGGGSGNPTQKYLATLTYMVNWLVSVIDALIPSKNANSKFRNNIFSF